jgi:hypothetical protein
MIELTKHQEALLTRLARGKIKYYATQTSIEADGAAGAQIDSMFAEDMRLVEDGLQYNVTSLPRFKEYTDGVKKEFGRDVFVLTATELVKLMFGPPRGSTH